MSISFKFFKQFSVNALDMRLYIDNEALSADFDMSNHVPSELRNYRWCNVFSYQVTHNMS